MAVKTSKAKRASKQAIDKFEWLTDRFISLIEHGVNPWRKEWRVNGSGAIMNFVTGHAYSGRNPLILQIDTMCRGSGQAYYCGASQGFAKGWNIKKGSKAAYVTYANTVVKEGADGEDDKVIPFVKWSAVFHIDDWDDSQSDHKIVDCLPEAKEPLNQDDRLQAVDEFIKGTGANILTQGSQPCYIPSKDTILMPAWEDFTGAEAYYATELHELTHWTGHASRCNRNLEGSFGTQKYAKEELIAEMGAALLCQHFGISSDLENHASYIKGWLQRAKEDPKFLFKSMGEARKAYEMLMA